MKNITLSVDEDTYRLARVAAAERDTTVSALVREYLRRLAQAPGSPMEQSAALFAALDQAAPNRAGGRLSREEAHARRAG
ncbi:MAG: hypothetical protein HZB71_01895 [Betaproteobacteria bacterium]|nr:hypothetical protein [Betaproteobacteria bacterium]